MKDNVIRFPLNAVNDNTYSRAGALITRGQKKIKGTIDLYQHCIDVLYQMEITILQEPQTEFSDHALQGIDDLIRWHYDKVEQLTSLL